MIIGILNKHTTQLKSKKFAGGVRPKIEMRTLEIQNHEIDVLIINNTRDTPYYLIENFQDKERKDRVVRANYIYTRVSLKNYLRHLFR